MERSQRTHIWEQDQVHKQQQEIEKLLKEQGELRQDLAGYNRMCHRRQDEKDNQRYKDLLQQRTIQEVTLMKLKESRDELQRKSKKINLENVVVTRESKPLKATLEEKLEDKLYRATTHFTELLAKENHLREEMKALKCEQAYFHHLQNKLNEELQEINKKIGETVNLCTTEYDKRMELESNMTIRKKKEEEEFFHDYIKHEEQERSKLRELNLKGYMSIKSRVRSVLDNKLTHKQLLEIGEKKKDDSGEKSQDAFKEVITKIPTVTGEDNMDPHSIFNQLKDQDSTFSFLCEQNRYAGTQKNEIRQLQDEIEQLQVKGAQQEQDHRCSLSDLDEQIKDTQSQAEDYGNQVDKLNNFLDDIKTVINSILSGMECDCSVMEDKLSSSAGIADHNIMMFLGLLEQQINELLTKMAFLHYKDQKKDYSSKDLTKYLLGQHPKLLQQSSDLQQDLRSMEFHANELPVTYEEEYPLSQEELRRRIMNDDNAMQDLQTEELAYLDALKSFPLEQ